MTKSKIMPQNNLKSSTKTIAVKNAELKKRLPIIVLRAPKVSMTKPLLNVPTIIPDPKKKKIQPISDNEKL